MTITLIDKTRAMARVQVVKEVGNLAERAKKPKIKALEKPVIEAYL